MQLGNLLAFTELNNKFPSSLQLTWILSSFVVSTFQFFSQQLYFRFKILVLKSISHFINHSPNVFKFFLPIYNFKSKDEFGGDGSKRKSPRNDSWHNMLVTSLHCNPLPPFLYPPFNHFDIQFIYLHSRLDNRKIKHWYSTFVKWLTNVYIYVIWMLRVSSFTELRKTIV